jgi:hypothetical protein
MTAQKFSAKEAAIKLGTDARTLRKFIRSSNDFDAVGQGNRYEFTAKELKTLEKKFKGAETKPAKKTKKKIEAPIEDQDAIDRTTEEVDLDDDDEPVILDDDIEEIDLEDEDL